MKKHISLQAKLMLTYSIFLFFLLLGLGIGFYLYNSMLYQKNTEKNLEQLVSKTSSLLDNFIREMDDISVELIFDNTLRDYLNELSLNIKQSQKDYNIIMAANIIKKIVILKSISGKEIYRISIFNKDGCIVSNRPIDNPGIKYFEGNNIAILDKIRRLNGGKYLVPPVKDIWSSNGQQVYSLVRMIRNPGVEIGFIEIQQPFEKVEQICNLQDFQVLVLNQAGEIIYSNSTIGYWANFYQTIIKDKNTEKGTMTVTPPGNNPPFIMSFQHSSYTGWTVLVSKNKGDLLAPLTVIGNITIFIGLGIIILTEMLFYIFTRQLTLPLKKLRKTIEMTSIHNLPGDLDIRHENNEIQALNKSFRRMHERLNESVEREINSRSHQIKAQFEALQAQINPHFLYNILSVIANMGDEAGNDKISAVCRNLAEMLRYSTNMKQKGAKLKEEIDNAHAYLSLMKKRFEDRLEYSINIDDSIMNIEVPKLIIQPMVENSISHGFKHLDQTMKIEITGGTFDNEWYIKIADNGSGFEPETLKNLKDKMAQYSNNLALNGQSLDLSIGGMGLLSTYARLLLHFGKELNFEIDNNDTTGAYIIIGSKILKPGSAEVNTNV